MQTEYRTENSKQWHTFLIRVVLESFKKIWNLYDCQQIKQLYVFCIALTLSLPMQLTASTCQWAKLDARTLKKRRHCCSAQHRCGTWWEKHQTLYEERNFSSTELKMHQGYTIACSDKSIGQPLQDLYWRGCTTRCEYENCAERLTYRIWRGPFK